MASGNIAHVQDAEEDTGEVIGPIKYARSNAPGSPTKEKANNGKPRKDNMRRTSSSPEHGMTDSSDETTVHPVMDKREKARCAKEREVERAAGREERRRPQKERERAERRAQEKAASKKPTRPSAKQMKTDPIVHTHAQQQPEEYRRPRFEDDASQYGVPQPAPGPAQGHRPRAMSNRPASYYGQGSRPPPSNERWYANSPFAPQPQHVPMQAPMPVPMPVPMPGESPFTPPSYPPSWQQAQGMPYGGHAMPPPSNDYFPPPHAAPTPHAAPVHQQNLAHRFQTRPSSSLGYRSMSGSYEHEPFEKENMPRRRSVKIREEDRKAMPPPPRPKTSQPQRHALRPPPQQRQIAYEAEDLTDDDSMLQELVPHGAYDYEDGVLDRPSAHRRGSSTYSREAYRIEPASTHGRRHSYMGGGGSSYESKYEGALAYQAGVTGGPSMPLTAAALKANKKSKSSRSSGSSESRDESEFRQSATTRTTRSSAIDSEDVTIKVTGAAVVKFGNAEIQCHDGGEINITQPGRIGGSSDKASTVYSEERLPRKEQKRLPVRARSSSQADTFSRVSSTYDYPLQGRPPFF